MGGGDMEREQKNDDPVTQKAPASGREVVPSAAAGVPEDKAQLPDLEEPGATPMASDPEEASKAERAKEQRRPVSAKEESAKPTKGRGTQRKLEPNQLREVRIEQMMSKAELARKAGLSVLTIDRIEKGFGCRMDTKRKILKALGLKLSDRRKVFKDD